MTRETDRTRDLELAAAEIALLRARIEAAETMMETGDPTFDDALRPCPMLAAVARLVIDHKTLADFAAGAGKWARTRSVVVEVPE